MPASMSASSAASSSRSTVHHQAAKGVGSRRETMASSRSSAWSSGRSESCLALVSRRLTAAGSSTPVRVINAISRQVTPGSARTSSRNAVAAHLEIAVLVERRAGRRQQHDRLLDVGRLGIAGGELDRAVERAGDHVRHAPFEFAGESGGRLADQIGLADARKEAARARRCRRSSACRRRSRTCRRSRPAPGRWNPHWSPWNR